MPPWKFFAGLRPEPEEALFHVIPAPYDETSDRRGAAEGPAAILAASQLLELYDLQSGTTPSDKGIHTATPLKLGGLSPGEMLAEVEAAVSRTLSAGKFPLTLGGEHSVTLGALRAASKKFSSGGLSVLFVDAHADLRNEYNETKYSHACVARRAREIVHAAQAGIRSMSAEEQEFIRSKKIENIFYGSAFSAASVAGALRKNVYVSIDLDALDPSLMPAVSCPEPGGLDWPGLAGLVSGISRRKRIVGADIVELSPLKGNHTPDFIAAKLAHSVMASVSKAKIK